MMSIHDIVTMAKLSQEADLNSSLWVTWSISAKPTKVSVQSRTAVHVTSLLQQLH